MECGNYCTLKMLREGEAGRYPYYFFCCFYQGLIFSSNVRFLFFELALQVHTYIKPVYRNIARLPKSSLLLPQMLVPAPIRSAHYTRRV